MIRVIMYRNIATYGTQIVTYLCANYNGRFLLRELHFCLLEKDGTCQTWYSKAKYGNGKFNSIACLRMFVRSDDGSAA